MPAGPLEVQKRPTITSVQGVTKTMATIQNAFDAHLN